MLFWTRRGRQRSLLCFRNMLMRSQTGTRTKIFLISFYLGAAIHCATFFNFRPYILFQLFLDRTSSRKSSHAKKIVTCSKICRWFGAVVSKLRASVHKKPPILIPHASVNKHNISTPSIFNASDMLKSMIFSGASKKYVFPPSLEKRSCSAILWNTAKRAFQS